jgi:SLT domain-containing protein
MAMFESAGDPHAINKWDSNWEAGTPSKGLMQVIDPTFARYHVTGHGDIWNPVDNVAAASNYIASRYGDPWNTPGERSLARGGPYQGYEAGGRLPVASYDDGGWLPPGASVAVNGTGRPERVGGGETHLHLHFDGTVIVTDRTALKKLGEDLAPHVETAMRARGRNNVVGGLR